MWYNIKIRDTEKKSRWYSVMQNTLYHACFEKIISGCSVTANMLVLGTSDSGFESRHPDQKIEIKMTLKKVIFVLKL